MSHIASDLIPIEVDVLRELCKSGRRFMSTADVALDLDQRYAAVASALVTLRRRGLVTDRSGPGAVKYAATGLGEHALAQLDAGARG